MISRMTELLAHLSPFVWPLIGASLLGLALMLRRLRRLEIDSLELIEPAGVAALTALAFAIDGVGEQQNVETAAVVLMSLAAMITLTFIGLRLGGARLVPDLANTPLRQWHSTTFLASLTCLALTLLTSLCTLQPAADRSRPYPVPVATLLPVAAICCAAVLMMLIIELLQGLEQRKLYAGRHRPE
jgi:hypothetical protein